MRWAKNMDCMKCPFLCSFRYTVHFGETFMCLNEEREMGWRMSIKNTYHLIGPFDSVNCNDVTIIGRGIVPVQLHFNRKSDSIEVDAAACWQRIEGSACGHPIYDYPVGTTACCCKHALTFYGRRIHIACGAGVFLARGGNCYDGNHQGQ